jgi:hypothetical protein
MLRSLVQRKNRIIDHQRHFQADNGVPLYLKGNNDAVYFRFFVSLAAVGLSGVVYGVYSLVTGKNKK